MGPGIWTTATMIKKQALYPLVHFSTPPTPWAYLWSTIKGMKIFLQKCEKRIEILFGFFPLKILTKCVHISIPMIYCKEKNVLLFFSVKGLNFLWLLFPQVYFVCTRLLSLFFLIKWLLRDLFPYQEKNLKLPHWSYNNLLGLPLWWWTLCLEDTFIVLGL